MQDTRIALVQMEATAGKTKENLQKIKHFVMEAVRKKVDIICFPELAVHGYSKENAVKLAENIPGVSSQFLSGLAKEKGILISVGFIEKSENFKPFIAQLAFFPDGKIEKYRKTHLGLSEKPFFSPGEDLPIFQTKKVSFAHQVCWDMHFPEVSTIYSMQGAEIIFAPHASPKIMGSRRESWMKFIQARAYDNSVFLACCNLIGQNGEGSEFCGGCIVFDAKGEIVAEDFRGEESLLIVDLTGNEINKVRSKERKSMRDSFFLKYRRPELYSKILNSYPERD